MTLRHPLASMRHSFGLYKCAHRCTFCARGRPRLAFAKLFAEHFDRSCLLTDQPVQIINLTEISVISQRFGMLDLVSRFRTIRGCESKEYRVRHRIVVK